MSWYVMVVDVDYVDWVPCMSIQQCEIQQHQDVEYVSSEDGKD